MVPDREGPSVPAETIAQRRRPEAKTGHGHAWSADRVVRAGCTCSPESRRAADAPSRRGVAGDSLRTMATWQGASRTDCMLTRPEHGAAEPAIRRTHCLQWTQWATRPGSARAAEPPATSTARHPAARHCTKKTGGVGLIAPA